MSANDWADDRLNTLLANRYRVNTKLGTGGMGAVYSARDEAQGSEVAVKVLDPQLAEHPYFLQRFEREAKAAGKVAGGRVPRILDSGHDASSGPFLVMELLQGRTLATHLKSVGPLSFEESLRIVDDILEILVAVHEGGIVHRDLKPANVFLEGTGSPWDVRVIDFGVARFFELNRDTLLTLPGSVVGTPRYMPPEQAKDSSRVDPRCDVYAAGALLYSCLAGVPPYHDRVGVDITVALLTGPPTAIDQLVPQLPEAIVALVSRSMAREVGERFSSAREMRDALGAARASLSNYPTTSDPPPGEHDLAPPDSWRPRFNTTFEGQVLEVAPAGGTLQKTVNAKPVSGAKAGSAPETLPDGSRGPRHGAGAHAPPPSFSDRESASVPLPKTMALGEQLSPRPETMPGAYSAPRGVAEWNTGGRRSRMILWVLLTVPLLVAGAFYVGYLWAIRNVDVPGGAALGDETARRSFEEIKVNPLVMTVGTGADPVAQEIFSSMKSASLFDACQQFDRTPQDGTVTYDRELGRLDCKMIRLTKADWPAELSFENWYLSELLAEYTALQNGYLALSRRYPTHNDCTFGHLGSSQDVMRAIVAAGDASEATVGRWRHAAVQSYSVAALYSADSACSKAAAAAAAANE